MELDTIIGSDLFSQDEYIKQYLLDPDISLITAVKIGLRYYVSADSILQLNVFKDHVEKINPFLFLDVFGKQPKGSKSGNIWLPNDLYGESALLFGELVAQVVIHISHRDSFYRTC